MKTRSTTWNWVIFFGGEPSEMCKLPLISGTCNKNATTLVKETYLRKPNPIGMWIGLSPTIFYNRGHSNCCICGCKSPDTSIYKMVWFVYISRFLHILFVHFKPVIFRGLKGIHKNNEPWNKARAHIMVPERFENRMIQSSTAPLLKHPHGFRESRRFFPPFQISYLLLLEQKLDVSDSCQKTTQVGARLAFQ